MVTNVSGLVGQLPIICPQFCGLHADFAVFYNLDKVSLYHMMSKMSCLDLNPSLQLADHPHCLLGTHLLHHLVTRFYKQGTSKKMHH